MKDVQGCCIMVVYLFCFLRYFSVEESQDFASCLFTTRLFVGHDSIGCGQDNMSELSTGQKIDHPLFQFTVGAVESGGDNTTLVETSIQLDHNLLRTMIVNNFEFGNVAVCLHAEQELDNHLGRRPDQDLSATTLFGVGDCLQTIGENRHANHLCCCSSMGRTRDEGENQSRKKGEV